MTIILSSKPTDKEGRDRSASPAGNIVSFMAITSMVRISDQIWVSDSGSSIHVSSNREWFKIYRYLGDSIPVKLGNKESMYAIGCGDIETTAGVIKSVYHVPGLVSKDMLK